MSRPSIQWNLLHALERGAASIDQLSSELEADKDALESGLETLLSVGAVARTRSDGRLCYKLSDSGSESVEIVFSPEVAPFIRGQTWHPRQQLEELSDGGLRFRAEMVGRREATGWILAWGQHARLVRPAKWRRELALHAAAIWAAYEQDYRLPSSGEGLPLPRIPAPRHSDAWRLLSGARRTIRSVPEFRSEWDEELRWVARLADRGLLTLDEVRQMNELFCDADYWASRPLKVTSDGKPVIETGGLVNVAWMKVVQVYNAITPWRPVHELALLLHQAAVARSSFLGYCRSVSAEFRRALYRP